MKRAYTFRPHADRPALEKAIVRTTKSNPDFTPTEIAKLLNCSHVTVRKVQRKAGIYRPRGAAGVLLAVTP